MMNIEDQINTLIARQDADVRKEVGDQFRKFWSSHEIDEGGEFNEEFKEIHPTSPFNLSVPPTPNVPCRDLLIYVFVLARIFCIKFDNTGPIASWKGLNLDAKGFCRTLIEADPSANADDGDLRTLLAAKQVVAFLLKIDHLDQPTPRDFKLPPPPPTKAGALSMPNFDE